MFIMYYYVGIGIRCDVQSQKCLQNASKIPLLKYITDTEGHLKIVKFLLADTDFGIVEKRTNEKRTLKSHII